jgi:formamidopyrimidine-DNA glycosylase
MPEIAETFIIAHQLAQTLGVPFESDSGLVLSKDRYIPLKPVGNTLTFDPLDSVYAYVGKWSPMTIEKIWHRGKKIELIGYLANRLMSIEVSLGMTGRFSVVPSAHDRIRINGGNGASFWYSDIRKFGSFGIEPVTSFFGHDCRPSVTNPNVDVEDLYLRLVFKQNATIKQRLVEQTEVIAGLGNYMANELLFRLKINPLEIIWKLGLSLADVNRILTVAKVLAEASVADGGCTLRDFKDMLGRPGRFQDSLQIYGKKICPVCRGPVTKRSSRSVPTSHFCLNCQPMR